MRKQITLGMIMAGFAVISLISCNDKPETDVEQQKETKDSIIKENKDVSLKPNGAAPEWGLTIKDEMAVVIEKLSALGGKPIETLTAKEARMQPTPTDAVMLVMKDHNMALPPALCDTVGMEIPVTNGKTHIRIYTPKEAASSYPVIVYYHGGVWVIADINVYNVSAQALCEQVGAIVVSVEYPKGPENKFPAAHITAYSAYEWVVKNAATFKGDATKIAVVGESAGGNLAANVSIMARDKKQTLPVYEVLVYPVANNDMKAESYIKYAAAKPLNTPMMGWFVQNALGSPAKATDPRISLIKANLKGLPPTLIIAAEIDPLQSEGWLLRDLLKEADVETDYELYKGVTHEFFGMAAVVPQAREAQELVAKKLKSAFKNSN